MLVGSRRSQNLICLSSTPMALPKSFCVQPMRARAARIWRQEVSVTDALGLRLLLMQGFGLGVCITLNEWPWQLRFRRRQEDPCVRGLVFQHDVSRPECIEGPAFCVGCIAAAVMHLWKACECSEKLKKVYHISLKISQLGSQAGLNKWKRIIIISNRPVGCHEAQKPYFREDHFSGGRPAVVG